MSMLELDRKRPAFQSVTFMMNECCDAIQALEEIHRIHQQIIETGLEERHNLLFSQKTIHTMLGMARDCFCIRLANLFDKRKDAHSLKKYYKGEVIEKLEKHPITVAARNARNSNIAHMGKEYIKWPDIEDIISSNLKELLEGTRIALFLSRRV